MTHFIIPILKSDFKFDSLKIIKGLSLIDLNSTSKPNTKKWNENVALLINIDSFITINKEKIYIEDIISLVGIYLFIKTKKSFEIENSYRIKINKNESSFIVKEKSVNFSDKYGFTFFSFYKILFGRDRQNLFQRTDFDAVKQGLKHIKRYYALVRTQLYPQAETPFGVSINAFVSAFNWYMTDDPKLILTVTALESLFCTSSQELSHRLCHNISFFMYPKNHDINKRLLMYKRMKDIYNSRSKLVHGTNVVLNLDKYDDALYVFCEVIEKMIEVYKNEKIFMNRDLHTKFINNIELGYFPK